MIRNLTLKRRMLAASIVGALALLPLGQPAFGGHISPVEKTLRRKINAYRASKDKPTLKMKHLLASKARKQAKTMDDDGLLCTPTSTDPECEGKEDDHSSSAQLISYANAAGCDKPLAEPIAEIIASTTVLPDKSLDTIIEFWKDSSDHNAIMLKKKWERIGTGIHVDSDGHRWTVVLFCSTK